MCNLFYCVGALVYLVNNEAGLCLSGGKNLDKCLAGRVPDCALDNNSVLKKTYVERKMLLHKQLTFI